MSLKSREERRERPLLVTCLPQNIERVVRRIVMDDQRQSTCAVPVLDSLLADAITLLVFQLLREVAIQKRFHAGVLTSAQRNTLAKFLYVQNPAVLPRGAVPLELAKLSLKMFEGVLS